VYLRTDEQREEWPLKPLDNYWIGIPTVRFQWFFCFVRADIAKEMPELPLAETPRNRAKRL